MDHESREDEPITVVVQNSNSSPTNHINSSDANNNREEENAAELSVYRPKERLKTLLSLVLMLFVSFLSTVCLSVIHDYVPLNSTTAPDLIFSVIDRQHWAWAVADYSSGLGCGAIFVLIWFHRGRWILYRRAFVITAFTYLLRCVTISATILPLPYNSSFCLPEKGYTDVWLVLRRAVKYTFLFGQVSWIDVAEGSGFLCGDSMYSGHALSLTISGYFLWHYYGRRYIVFKFFALVIPALGYVTLIIGRGHYTIDVIIAYYVGTRTCWTYHSLTMQPRDWKTLKKLPISNAWWFPIFWWCEQNTPLDPMPLRLDWPLARPRSLKRFFKRL